MWWIISFFIVWYMYRVLTVKSRREKYLLQALIWKTGGVFQTGEVDIHKAVSLFKKASDLGVAQASFELGVLYEEGWHHPCSSNSHDQLRANEFLSHGYYRRCQRQSAELFAVFQEERLKIKQEVFARLGLAQEDVSDDSQDDEVFHDDVSKCVMDSLYRAYLHGTIFETSIGYADLIDFAEENFQTDNNGCEVYYVAFINGHRTTVKVYENIRNGNANVLVINT